MPSPSRITLLMVGLKRAIEEKFTVSDWDELGLLTGTTSLLDDHSRLFRSLRFQDDDYGWCISDVLPSVLGEDNENLDLVVDFVGLDAWLRERDPEMHSQIFGGGVVLAEGDLSALADPSAIDRHLRRLAGLVTTDPEHAIGVSKELIESTAKLVLTELGEPFDPKADISTLTRAAQKALALHPDALAPSAKGAESTKRVLGGLTSIAIGVAELRNLHGTGHGKVTAQSGLKPRHAQLAVDAATTYCRTLLATLADPEAPWRNRP